MLKFDILIVIFISVIGIFWLMNAWADLSQYVSAELIVRILGY